MKIDVLLIEDDEADAETVRRLLGRDFHVHHAESLVEGIAQLAARDFHVVLLDLELGDSGRGETLGTIRDHLGKTPAVILSGEGDDDEAAALLRHGAHDFLLKNDLETKILRRVVRFAIERAKLFDERDAARHAEARERELRHLAEASQRVPADEAAPRAAATLRHAAPAFFDDVVSRYATTLVRALERRIFKEGPGPVAVDLRALAVELCAQRVGPRDLVELHSTALESTTKDTSAAKSQALIEEGRLVLLELMGYVIAGYRRPKGTASA